MTSSTLPIWDARKIAELNEDENLFNLCLRLEHEYVTMRRHATYQGFCISRHWPAFGELGCGGKNGIKVLFVTTKNRSIKVCDPTGEAREEIKMDAGMSGQLYEAAQRVMGATE